MTEGYAIRDQAKAHFLTFTVTEWVDVFTRKEYKDVVIGCFRYCQKHKGLVIFGYVIMSNHIHLIIQSRNAALSDLIRDMKRHIANEVVRQINTNNESRQDWMMKRFEFAARKTHNNDNFKFWRDGNHPEEIYSDDFLWSKLNYIHLNPVRQAIVQKAHHYLYCSASNYILDSGLIDIELLTPPHSFGDKKGVNVAYHLW